MIQVLELRHLIQAGSRKFGVVSVSGKDLRLSSFPDGVNVPSKAWGLNFGPFQVIGSGGEASSIGEQEGLAIVEKENQNSMICTFPVSNRKH